MPCIYVIFPACSFQHSLNQLLPSTVPTRGVEAGKNYLGTSDPERGLCPEYLEYMFASFGSLPIVQTVK